LYQQSHSNGQSLRPELLLSLQRALLAEIPPSLRGVTCGLDTSKIVIHCFFEGMILEEDSESMERVATEVIADFPEHEVLIECIRKDAPKPLQSGSLQDWVYWRREW